MCHLITRDGYYFKFLDNNADKTHVLISYQTFTVFDTFFEIYKCVFFSTKSPPLNSHSTKEVIVLCYVNVKYLNMSNTLCPNKT